MPAFSWSSLTSLLHSACDPDLLANTRAHRLPSFDTAQAEVWVKREDESGFGVSGTKRRKYASLLPALQAAGVEAVALIGGPRSNHVVSLVQLLRERGLQPYLFLKEDHAPARGGNRFLIDLLTGPEEIQWVPSADWSQVVARAEAFMAGLDRPGAVIPEGGHHPGSVAGAATLAVDLHRHEADAPPFDHIFIDAGTGLSASGLRGGLRLAGHAAQLHVVLMAGDAASFWAQDEQVRTWSGQVLPQPFPPPARLHLHHPPTARAFGSVNATVLAETRRLARESGLLTDPVYTTKLFLAARRLIVEQALSGRILLIHSGGGTGLMGFASRLSGSLSP